MMSNISMVTDTPVTKTSLATNVTSVQLSPPEYMYVYVTLCNAVIFIIGVLGNAMVIHVVVRMRALRSRVNYFLVSLAVADLLVLMVCQPSAMLLFYTRERWLLGYFMCKTIPFLEHWTLHASVLTLLVIGFERYFTICRPLAEKNTICSSNASLLIFPVWIIASLLALPFVFMTNLVETAYYDNTKVKICQIKVVSPLARCFVIASFGVVFLIPLVLLIFLYSSVILTLRKLSQTQEEVAMSSDVMKTSIRRHHIHPTTAKSRRQVSRMMAAIVVLFFVTLLPFKILTLFMVFTSESTLDDLGFESYHNLLSIARLMMYVNSSGNPVIYAWMSPRFRRAFHLSTSKCRCPKDGSPKRGSFVRRNSPDNKYETPQVLL